MKDTKPKKRLEMLKAWLSRSPRAGEVEKILSADPSALLATIIAIRSRPRRPSRLTSSELLDFSTSTAGTDALLKFLGEAPEMSTSEWLSQGFINQTTCFA